MNPIFAMADAGQVLSRPDLEKMIDPLAAQVHDAWMRQRQAEGWSWGAVHNAALKQHPCLVAYEQLPESEKEVDRRTARTAIQGLMGLGFEVLPQKQSLAAESTAFAPVLQRLEGPTTIPLSELRDLWGQCRSSPLRWPIAIPLRVGERMLRQGEPILAYDVLSQGLAADSGASDGDAPVRRRLRQLLALALAQSGATDRAKDLLLNLCDQGGATPETLGLLGRVYKDLAGKAGSPEARSQCLAQSFEQYCAGFAHAEAAFKLHGKDADAGDATYCGINAGTVQVLRGETAAGRELAERVKQISLERLQRIRAAGGTADYWLTATLAEADLIAGHLAEAEGAYRAAAQLVRGNWRELSSTRRQARLLAPHLGLPPGFVEKLFPPIAVAVFSAPVLEHLDDGAGMPDWEEHQKSEMKQVLTEAGIVCGYASALSPADLLFIEAMLETVREINVVLPGPRSICRQVFTPAPAWAARFDRLLTRVQSVTEDTQPSCLDEAANRTFARLRALGAGILRARRLDAELHAWTAKPIPWSGARQGCPLVWHSLKDHRYPYATVKDESGPARAGPSAGGSDREATFAIRAMLFGDVKGYSKLSDPELLRFASRFMKRVAETLEDHAAQILSRRTAGDGLFLIFADLEAATAVALHLRDLVANTHWDGYGLPPHLGIRISLDAGPVYAYQDPVTRHDEVCGAYVNRAARIEPITPPNEVYASEAFAALQVASGSDTYRFDYVGQTQLPKGFGMTPLYCVNR